MNGKENPTNQKGTCLMKNASLSTIYTTLTNVGFENKDAIMEELYAEIHRGDTRKAANAAIYDTVWPIVAEALGQTTNPVTVAELWEAVKDADEAADFTKNKLSYGLTHQWADKVNKIEGKVNAYTLKA